LFIILSSTKPNQHSGSTFVQAPFEPYTFHSVICVVEFVCFRVNSCWSLCVHRRCFHRRFCPPPPRRSFHHFSPPCCTPCYVLESLPRFGYGKFCLCAKGKVSRKEKKARCQSIQNKKRQGAHILNKKRKRRKGKAAPYKATELHLGGRSFPLLGATPFPCFGIWCNILPYFRLSSLGKKNSGCCDPP